MQQRIFLFLLLLFSINYVHAQHADCGTASGMIGGNVLDGDSGFPLSGTNISLYKATDSSIIKTVVTNSAGGFQLNGLVCGLYRLVVKISGYAPMRIDSISIRQDHSDVNLTDISLPRSASNLEVLIVYAEKPLFENKDGKITFNASESALSNASGAIDLLKQTPLVSVDPDGKILMRGKEVKVLIDDKPVDMDARQLQDLLESMPGSMIEKIEVLTTPPPQFANERGGVINIVTKKGKVGISGRLNFNYGTRGEAGVGASSSYRNKKLAVNVNAGFTYNQYVGNGRSFRENFYADSSNYFKTETTNGSNSKKPNGRLAIDYEIDKMKTLNLTLQFNANENSGIAETFYKNLNRFNETYRLSGREVMTGSENQTPSVNFAFTQKSKRAGEVFKINGSFQWAHSNNERDFYQRFLHPINESLLSDSTQQQLTAINTRNSNLRFNYDRPIRAQKLSLHVSGHFLSYVSHNVLATLFLKKPENELITNEALSNDIRFFQKIMGVRVAMRYTIKPDYVLNAGILQEVTATNFDLTKISNDFKNNYPSALPFLTVTKKWNSGYSITGSYRRTVQRPGLNQLNPSVDYSDPFNLRFGNPYLNPYYADNLDVILGYWRKKFTFNFSAGYNKLRDIYSSIRTLQPDTKTITTWENISGRTEYESSIWTGLTLSKKLKINASVGYTYNVYSLPDRTDRRYRNGGSFTSSLNGNYLFSALLNGTGSFTYNSFATPQGKARNRLSMNVGLQQKFLKKTLTLSLQAVDPFSPQQNNTIVSGKGYVVESYSYTRSENYRLALAYTFKKVQQQKKKGESKSKARSALQS